MLKTSNQSPNYFMTLKCVDDAQILTKLGLTTRQAKVYLVLAQLGKANITNLSAAARIDRANVYRIIVKLQDLSLVKKVIASPIVFEALPVVEGITLLLERQEKEQAEVKVKANELLEKHLQDTQVTSIEEDYEFALIPEGKFTFRKIDEIASSNQRTNEIIMYWRDLEERVDEFIQFTRTLLEKGVQVRVVLFFDRVGSLPKKIEDLKQSAGLHLRVASESPECTLSVVDGEKAFLSLTPSLSSTPRLWIKNHILVSVIKAYFESIWRNSSELS